MTVQIKWKLGSKYVPVQLLPDYLRSEGLYVPGGYICEQCGWHTERVGFSGVQASRAHMRVHANSRDWVLWFRMLHALATSCVLSIGVFFDKPMNEPTLDGFRVCAVVSAIVISLVATLHSDRVSSARLTLFVIGWTASLISAWTIQVPANLYAIEPISWLGLAGITAGFWAVKSIARSFRRRYVDGGRRRYWSVWVPTSEEALEEHETWALGRSNVLRVPDRKT